MEHYQKYYTVSEYVTVDEHLGFEFICQISPQNMASSYGTYCANLQVYTGMVDRKWEVGESKRVVLDLVCPISQSRRSITADNFFFVLWIGRRIAEEQSYVCWNTS